MVEGDKNNDLSIAFTAIRAKNRRRGVETRFVTRQGTVVQAQLFLNDFLDSAKEPNQAWIQHNREIIVQRYPGFASISENNLEDAFVVGLHRIILQEYSVSDPAERGKLFDPSYLTGLVGLYAKDYVRALDTTLKVGVSAKESANIAAIVASIYDSNLPIRLHNLIVSSGVNYSIENIITMKLVDPEKYVRSLLENRKNREKLPQILKDQYPEIPQHIINTLVRNYKDPTAIAALFSQEVARLKQAYLFSPPVEYPYEEGPYPNWIYQEAIAQFGRSDSLLRTLPARIREMIHDHKEFRGLEIGVFAKALFDFKDKDRQIEFLQMYIKRHPVTLAREIQVEVLDLLANQHITGLSTKDLREKALAQIQARRPDLAVRISDIAKMESLFGFQILKLGNIGLISGKKDKAVTRGLLYTVTDALNIKKKQLVRDLIQSTNAHIMNRVGEQDIYSQEIQHAFFSKEEEKRLFEVLHVLPEGSAIRRELVGYIAQHNHGFVVSIAKEFLNRGLTIEELISLGNEGLSEAINRFDESTGYRLSSYAGYYIRGYILNNYEKRKKQVATVSLDDVQNEDARSLLEQIASPHATPDIAVLDREKNERLQNVLEEKLGQEISDIAIQAWGLLGNDPKTVEQIAKDLSRAEAEVRRLLKKARQLLKEDIDFITTLRSEGL